MTFIQKWKQAHSTRWPELNGTASIEAWRAAKEIEDKANAQAESDMTNAFGCHGEPIAKAISETLWSLFELVPEAKHPEAKRLLLTRFQAICDEMTDVRSSLDDAVNRMANEQRQEGWDAAEGSLPHGCDTYASDHGVDLRTTLEDAFEAGVNAISGYLDGVYPEPVCVGMDDL